MAFTLSTAANVLKTFYKGPIQEQLNQQAVVWSRLRKKTQAVSGKSITVPLHTNRNLQAGSGRADGGTLPSASQEGYSVAVIPTRYLYTRIEITGPTIDATRNDAGAFVRAMRSQIDGAAAAHARALNRQLHSDGTDAIAFWTGADDTSGATVDDNRGNAFVHIDSGAAYDLIDATDDSTVLGNSIVVTLGAKAAANYAITWTGTVSGSADTDYLVLEDSLGYQFQGLAGVVSSSDPTLPTGGLHGLAVASNSWWTAQEYNNSGTNRALTLHLLQKPLSDIVVNSGVSLGDVKFMLSNVFVKDEYVKLVGQDKRHVNVMELDGGHTAITFDNKPWIIDPQCRRNRVYYITPKSMALYVMNEVEWRDFDGNMFRNVANKDSWEAFLATIGDLACTQRNANGLLDDLTESSS